jgi:thioredoxin-related protein
MRYKQVGSIFAVVFMLGLILAGVTVAAGGIQWHPYKAGMDLGKKENKKIFLHFWAQWCDSCKIMAKETFADSAVIAYLNKNFISIRVNSDKERTIVSTYNVRGLPDNWFIAEKNEIIGNQPGNIPPDKFLPLLRYIHSDSYKKMSFGKFLETK